jgi:ubiquinone biosynthesis protein COQ4
MSQIPGFDIDAFLKVCQDPNRTQETLNIGKKFVEFPAPSELFGPLSEAVSKSEGLQRLFRDRYLPRLPKMDELAAFPEGSLGKELANHLTSNQINLEFAGLDTAHYYDQIKTPVEYLRMRALRLHDIQHVVAGLSTSLLDEYALAAFQYGQFASPYYSVVLASGLIHFTFYRPREVPQLMDVVSQYYEIGKRCELWLGVPWEEHWETPLVELRARYLKS